MTTNGAKSGLNVTIRPTRREDFDEIIPLLKQLWPASPIDFKAARDIFDKGLTSARRAYLCACLGEKIIGFGTLMIRDVWLGGMSAICDRWSISTAARESTALVVPGDARARCRRELTRPPHGRPSVL
jgi:hypothetical protein